MINYKPKVKEFTNYQNQLSYNENLESEKILHRIYLKEIYQNLIKINSITFEQQIFNIRIFDQVTANFSPQNINQNYITKYFNTIRLVLNETKKLIKILNELNEALEADKNNITNFNFSLVSKIIDYLPSFYIPNLCIINHLKLKKNNL